MNVSITHAKMVDIARTLLALIPVHAEETIMDKTAKVSEVTNVWFVFEYPFETSMNV